MHIAKKQVFRILAAIPLATISGRKIFNGLHRFLGEGHYTWDIELIRRDRELEHILKDGFDFSSYDGLLMAFAETSDMRKQHTLFSLPTVFIDYPDPIRNKLARHAFVHDNEKAIAEVATQHLLACGNRSSFCYVPTRYPTNWSMKRQEAFAARLRRAGKPLNIFPGNGENRTELANWLLKQDKPIAVLAAFDERAVDVLEASRSVGLAVPTDVAILGVGNDELICETTDPPLSSVKVSFEQQGYRAARELQALIMGGKSPRRDIAEGTASVEQRLSTPGAIQPEALVRRALNFIAAHALEGISSRDVATHLHVSRRLADLRFREICHQSILEAIDARRFAEVERLLRTSTLSIKVIAERCGFHSADVLRILFKRRTGLSPRAWKLQLRHGRTLASSAKTI